MKYIFLFFILFSPFLYGNQTYIEKFKSSDLFCNSLDLDQEGTRCFLLIDQLSSSNSKEIKNSLGLQLKIEILSAIDKINYKIKENEMFINNPSKYIEGSFLPISNSIINDLIQQNHNLQYIRLEFEKMFKFQSEIF